jgi:ABC-type Mn2+/Zn2+ transport system ATPase subunit
MGETDSVAIVISGLSFSYGGHPVLEDVSLSISQGDFVSVVGPNGVGKATLFGLLRPVCARSWQRIPIYRIRNRLRKQWGADSVLDPSSRGQI